MVNWKTFSLSYFALVPQIENIFEIINTAHICCLCEIYLPLKKLTDLQNTWNKLYYLTTAYKRSIQAFLRLKFQSLVSTIQNVVWLIYCLKIIYTFKVFDTANE